MNISLNYILWMIEHPDELNKWEELWVKTFTNLLLEGDNYEEVSKNWKDTTKHEKES